MVEQQQPAAGAEYPAHLGECGVPVADRRRVNGRRRYTRAQLTRVAIIMRGREVGIGLDQLRMMLGADDAAARRAVLQRHRDELDRRIAVATASRDLLDHALDCPVQDFLECPDFQRLVQGPGCRLDS